jgi:hypothetical protein
VAEWIEWKGGDCPVHPDTFVDVKDRDGFIWTECRACFHCWQHGTDTPDEEPISYRISSPELPIPSQARGS